MLAGWRAGWLVGSSSPLHDSSQQHGRCADLRPSHAAPTATPCCRRRMGGAEAERQWRALEVKMRPLQAGAALFPAAAIRGDPGVLLTAGRYGPGLLRAGLVAGQLTGPFSGKQVTGRRRQRQQQGLQCWMLQAWGSAPRSPVSRCALRRPGQDRLRRSSHAFASPPLAAPPACTAWPYCPLLYCSHRRSGGERPLRCLPCSA